MTSQQSEDGTLHRIATKQRLKRAKKDQKIAREWNSREKGGMGKELKGFDEFQSIRMARYTRR
jgi:hypothetical protein